MTSVGKESTLVVAFDLTHTQSSQKVETVCNVDVVVAMYQVVWDLSLLLSDAEYELQHWRTRY